MKILTILGARPQFIKASLVSREIARVNKENSDSYLVDSENANNKSPIANNQLLIIDDSIKFL